MKLSKSLLQAMLVAVTAGTILSCEKPAVVESKKTAASKQKADSIPTFCPGCGMG